MCMIRVFIVSVHIIDLDSCSFSLFRCSSLSFYWYGILRISNFHSVRLLIIVVVVVVVIVVVI